MNLHPIIVHFPIACLVLYSMIEIGSIFSPRVKKNLETTKYFLLLIWVIGTFTALQSGEIAQQSFGESDLIHTHEEFGEKSHLTYIIIGCFYLAKLIINKRFFIKYWTTREKSHLKWFISFVDSKVSHYIIALISLIGVVLLSITWALGWAISHGQDTDPIVSIVYDIFIGE